MFLGFILYPWGLILAHFGRHWQLWWLPWTKKTREVGNGAQQVNLVTNLGCLLASLLGGFWPTCSALFFFRVSGTLKKGVRDGLQNKFRFFLDLGVCPESLRRVHSHAIAQFSLLQPDPKRVPKWEPKWSLLSAKFVTTLLCGRPSH